MRYYLYQHIRLDTNEIFYIGIGTKPKKNYNSPICIYKRAYNKTQRNKFWKNIVNKTEYKVEILLESNDYDIVKLEEIRLVALYGRRDLNLGSLVNLTDAGEGRKNVIVSKETKLKQSIAKLGKKLSKDSINKRTETCKLKAFERGYWHKKEVYLKAGLKVRDIHISKDKRDKIAEMLNNGLNKSDIMREMKTSFHSIKKIIVEYNINYINPKYNKKCQK